MKGPRLFETDFDGTTHLTDELSPNGINVDIAYREGLALHIDSAAADKFYAEKHQGRDPFEIVRDVMPEGTDQTELKALAKLVAETKLELMDSSFGLPTANGEPWPRLTPGFGNLWRAISRAKANGELIFTATLSAGHTDFQKKAFDVHDLEHPDLFFTKDVLDAMSMKRPHDTLTKPNTFMFEQVKAAYLWILNEKNEGRYFMDDIRTIFTGDNYKRDGGLARKAGVRFELIEESSSEAAWQRVGNFLGIGDIALSGAVNG